MIKARGSGRQPFVVAAAARSAGSIVIARIDPGAYAPGFTLTPAFAGFCGYYIPALRACSIQ